MRLHATPPPSRCVGFTALRLDVNKPDEVAAAAALASDVTLVINNAGIAQPGGFLAADSEEVARRIFETNFFGMLRISKAFAPILERHGGGALLNVLSVASWVSGGGLAAYFGEQVCRLVAHQCAARRTGGAEDAGAGAAHGLCRHRSHARIRCAEVQR